jgi:hypothetical protein
LKREKERGYRRKRGNGEKLGIASKYLGLKPLIEISIGESISNKSHHQWGHQ